MDWKLEMGPSLQILIGPRDLKHPEKKPLLNPGTKSGIREAAALSEGRGQTRQPGAGGSRKHKRPRMAKAVLGKKAKQEA